MYPMFPSQPKRQKNGGFSGLERPTWMPGGVSHVHERGEGLGGVGHGHIHPAQARALRQRVLCNQTGVQFESRKGDYTGLL